MEEPNLKQKVIELQTMIFIMNLLRSRHINWAVDPFFAVTFRSAITKGYDYSVTPNTQIVDFFDPGYLTQKQ